MGKMVSIEGLNKFRSKLKNLTYRSGPAVERGLKRGALQIFREAQQEVPVDEGNLKGSGFVRQTAGRGLSAEFTIGYTASYAVYVHENLDAAHGAEYNTKYEAERTKYSAKLRDEKGRFLKGSGEKTVTASKYKKRGENQKAKFLEDPARRNIPAVVKFVQEEVVGAIKKI